MFTVDTLAQEIRRVDGNHSLGAGALAEALMPFLAALAVQTQQGVEVKPHGWIVTRKSGGGIFMSADRYDEASAAAEADIHDRGYYPIYRSALVDVPAVESEPNELAAYWGHMAAVFSDLDITIPRLGGEQRKKLADKAAETAKALYTRPPHREGEDSAEVIPHDPTDAMVDAAMKVDWGGDGDERVAAINIWHVMYSAALAATRSGSATSPTGTSAIRQRGESDG